MKKMGLGLMCLITVLSVFPMDPDEEKPPKSALLIASGISTWPFSYFMIKKHCPTGNECWDCAISASTIMIGQFFCMNYYYPETEAERAMHNRQFDTDKILTNKKKLKEIEKKKKD